MAAIINVTSLLDPANNDLAPKNLANDLDGLASATLMLQGYALVLASQPRLMAPADSMGLVSTTVNAQIALRNHASFVLNSVISAALKQVSDASMAANLFSALTSALPQLPQGSSQGLTTLLQAMVGRYQSCADDSTDLATLAEREAGKLASAEQNLGALLDKVSASLDGPDGSITRLQTAITQKKAAIANDIEAIMKSGQDLSTGLKQLGTGIVTTFAPNGATEVASTAPVTASNLRAVADTDGPPNFSVEGIGAISNDIASNRDAVQQLINANHDLADLYQQLAQLNGLLTAATAVRDQCTDYYNAFQRFVLYADQLEKTWAQIVAGAQQTVATVQQAPSDDFDHQTQAMVNVAGRFWQRVLDRSKLLSQAFATGTNTFSGSLNLSTARSSQ